MLDGFIIDRIRREREKHHDDRPVLQIEEPRPRPDFQPRQPTDHDQHRDNDRGIIEVDFTI